ncbi:MAG: XRE family transcriptional regulator [Propionicimonas sp.]
MSNERLRTALFEARVSQAALAAELQVDPKTVERWITTGRLPHRSHRLTIARLLRADDGYLWPSTLEESASQSAATEIVGTYVQRTHVATATWLRLIEASSRNIDILAYAATFLHDSIPDAIELLNQRLEDGVQVRLLLGNPSSRQVALRGEEEGIGAALAARCDLSWLYWRPTIHAGALARQHGTPLYTSMFRFDDELLVNHHLYGYPAGQAPVFHLKRIAGGRLFDRYLDSFERIWEGATERG